MPPVIWRIFGWEIADAGDFELEDDGGAYQHETDGIGKGPAEVKMLRRKQKKSGGGLGFPLSDVKLEDGTVVDGGKILMRDQWNTALHAPLEAAFQEGLKAKVPDVRFHKERLTGLWGGSNDCQTFLEKQGINTLLFAGVNTDQCVLATLQDACTKSWDTILLKDGCGTTSPEYATKLVEYNCQKSWGFLSSCEELAKGVGNLVDTDGNLGEKVKPGDEL
jgi:nicotinamidase-related amidase